MENLQTRVCANKAATKSRYQPCAIPLTEDEVGQKSSEDISLPELDLGQSIAPLSPQAEEQETQPRTAYHKYEPGEDAHTNV